jgi:hypothetical protein
MNGDPNPNAPQTMNETTAKISPKIRQLPRGRHLRLVRLLRFIREVWNSPYDIEPIREAHRKASEQYEEAVLYYYQCEEDQVNSFLAHNDASYWKGRRDALNTLLHSLPNA